MCQAVAQYDHKVQQGAHELDALQLQLERANTKAEAGGQSELVSQELRARLDKVEAISPYTSLHLPASPWFKSGWTGDPSCRRTGLEACRIRTPQSFASIHRELPTHECQLEPFTQKKVSIQGVARCSLSV